MRTKMRIFEKVNFLEKRKGNFVSSFRMWRKSIRSARER